MKIESEKQCEESSTIRKSKIRRFKYNNFSNIITENEMCIAYDIDVKFHNCKDTFEEYIEGLKSKNVIIELDPITDNGLERAYEIIRNLGNRRCESIKRT